MEVHGVTKVEFPNKTIKFRCKIFSQGMVLFTHCDAWIKSYFEWNFDSNDAWISIDALVQSSKYAKLTKILFDQNVADVQYFQMQEHWVELTRLTFDVGEVEWRFKKLPIEIQGMWQIFAENTNDLWSVLDENGYYLYVNEVWHQILGYKTNTLMGTHFADYLMKSDVEPTLRVFEESKRGKKETDFINVLKTQDDQSILVSWKTIPFQNKLFCLGRNLTDLMQNSQLLDYARQEIASKDFILQNVINSISQPIVVLNAKNRAVVFQNTAFQTQFEANTQLIPLINCNEEESCHFCKKDCAIKKATIQNKSNQLEFKFTNNIGQTEMYSVYLHPIVVTPDEVDLLVLHFFSKTELNKITRELKSVSEIKQQIFDSSPDGIMITDLTGVLTDANERIIETIGATCNEEFVGKNILDFVHPDDAERANKAMENMFYGVFLGAEVYKSLRLNQEVFYNEVNAQFIKNEKGEPEAILYFTREVTQRIKEAEIKSFKHEFQQRITHFSRKLIQLKSNDFEGFIQNALEEIGLYFGVDRVFIFEFHKNDTLMNNTFEWCADGIPSFKEKLQNYPLEIVPIFNELAVKQKIFHVPDVSRLNTSTELFKILDVQGIKTLLALPIFRAEFFRGYLGFDSVHRHTEYDKDIIELLELFASVLGDAFMRNRIERNLIAANRKLKQSERQFKLIAQNTSDGILVVNNQFKIEFISDAYLKLFGFENEPSFRSAVQRIGQLIAPSFYNKIIDLVFDAIEQKLDKITYRYLGLQKDGSELWREDSTSFVYDANNNFSKAYIICRDIHERVLSEMEVANLNETLQLATKTAGLGLWTYTFDNQIFKFDEQMAALFGLDIKTQNSISYQDFLRLLKSEDAIGLDHYVDEIIVGNTLYNDATFRVILPDGNVRHVKATGQIFRNDEGIPERALGVCYDISDLKNTSIQIERLSKMQALLIDIAVRYINLEPQDVDFGIHNAFEQIGEFTQADRVYIFTLDESKQFYRYSHEWCAKGVSTQIDNNEVNESPRNFIEAFFDIEKAESYVVRDVNELPDSEFKVILISQEIKSCAMYPIIVNGEYHGFVGFDFVRNKWEDNENNELLLRVFAQIMANLYRKLTLESRLIEEKERANTASAAKSQFLANMSHEIRTPLNGVLGFTELLDQSHVDHIQQQYIDNIKTSGKSLLGIINDILDFSKIEAGKLDLELADVSPLKVVEEVSDLMKISASQKGLEFLLDVPLSLPEKAVLDALRLKQVLMNLLNNAIKFTEKGTVKLGIRYRDTSKGKGKFSFFISDTGIGIKPEDHHKLFQAFSQADNSTTRRFGGTGLGLIISNLLVSKMKGKINFESEFGKGSTFFFDIETEVMDANFEELPNFKTLNQILLVDDHVENLNILGRHLNYFGIQADLCDHATSAIQHLTKQSAYNAVLIDCTMPDISGSELVNLIRNRLKFSSQILPIIMMCAKQPDEETQKIIQSHGVQYLISKPIKPSELKEVLGKLIDNKPLMEEKEISAKIEDSVKNLTSTIIIAEDNKISMLLMRTILSRLLPMANIIEAENGLEVIEAYEKYKPDLILMDVQMPEMDGLEASRLIREKEMGYAENNTVIIALTAGALKEEEQRCYESGMDGFLTKPVQQSELIEVFTNYLM